jgi:predicted GIY-YIG superfamily endonuclease
MESEFIDLGFDKYLYARDRHSLADSFTSSNRCGIYILHFQNREYYVGLAIDIVKRHAQHRLNHTDIEYISFREVGKTKLAEVEKEIVYQLEKLKKPLRNINLVSIINGNSDLDLIVSIEEQLKWKNYELCLDRLTVRFDYPELRRKYAIKFDKLRQSKYFEPICGILQSYIRNAIPFPCRTEYSFWSCSCLPSVGKKIFSRVNIFWQEVLTIYEDEFINYGDKKKEVIKDLAVSLHLCRSKLFENYSRSELKEKFPSIEFEDHFYEPGGQDQLNVFIGGFEFLDFLEDLSVLNSIKEFNLRLMRKGGCVFNRYHCFGLADEALNRQYEV